MTRQRLIVLITALGLILLVTPFHARAAYDTPEEAARLVNDTPISGLLPGNQAGSFAYFYIDYPGNDVPVTIRTTFRPADPAIRQGLGFNVYGPHGKIGSSHFTPEPGVAEFVGRRSEAARWLIQVYNYRRRPTVSYSVEVQGLPEPAGAVRSPVAQIQATANSAPTPVATDLLVEAPTATMTPPPLPRPTPTPTSEAVDGIAIPEIDETEASGVVVGNRGGAFRIYRLPSLEGVQDVRVRMTFTPDTPDITDAVGFTVYGPRGRIASGTGEGGEPGVREATFSLDEEGAYLVQIYNYAEGLPLVYTLTVSW
jgi:hypothetical protein